MNEVVKNYTKEYAQLIEKLKYDIDTTSELLEVTMNESVKLTQKMELQKVIDQEEYKKDLEELYLMREKLKYSYKKLDDLENSCNEYKNQLLEDIMKAFFISPEFKDCNFFSKNEIEKNKVLLLISELEIKILDLKKENEDLKNENLKLR